MGEPSRQAFLGSDFDLAISHVVVAVVGLSGGGSHVIQQLAHVGVSQFRVFDPKPFEAKHLHRLVGGKAADAEGATLKTTIAARTVRGIRPNAEIICEDGRWQERPDAIKEADLVFGCVDRFDERLQLEVACRRSLIPMIDIGMAVLDRENLPPMMTGQVAVSLPGHPCLQCMQVITPAALRDEQPGYGVAGPAAQVIYANGVLASTAVAMAVQMISGWSGEGLQHLLLRYDGNAHTVTPCRTEAYVRHRTCTHFPLRDVGPPRANRSHKFTEP